MFQQLNIAVLPQKYLKDPDQTIPPDPGVVPGFFGDGCSFPLGEQPALVCVAAATSELQGRRGSHSARRENSSVSLCHLSPVFCDSWVGKSRQNRGSVM